jgi:hypothetical protein
MINDSLQLHEQQGNLDVVAGGIARGSGLGL